MLNLCKARCLNQKKTVLYVRQAFIQSILGGCGEGHRLGSEESGLYGCLEQGRSGCGIISQGGKVELF